jgi:hypothetical protein
MIILSLLIFSIACGELSDSEKRRYREEMHELSMKFGGTLKNFMMSELRSGGPMQALTICADTAQVLTLNFSELHDVDIRRVSLRTRNKQNNPDDYELAVLNKWQRISDGGDVVDTNYVVELVDDEDGTYLRYMEPIIAQGVCLTCHGTDDQIPDDIKEYLKAKYPDDNGKNFTIGDLRGAISIKKEM